VDNHRDLSHPSAAAVGKKLKEAREKKSLTIEQVQKQSKIHSSVIKALEDGHASILLTDTYVRSFLKKYSLLLGLNSSDMLKEYFPPRQDAIPPSAPFEANPLPYETRIGPKALYFTGIAVFGIAALVVITMIGAKLVSSIGKAGMTQREKRIAEASASKKRQPKQQKNAQKKTAPAKAQQTSKGIVPKSDKLDLVIKVKEPVLVTLKRDGLLMYSVIMKKDTVDRITANDNIELEVAKTDVLDLTLNGQRIELPSRRLKSGIVITRKGVRLK
jgi:cytoskeletal protein RodZ